MAGTYRGAAVVVSLPTAPRLRLILLLLRFHIGRLVGIRVEGLEGAGRVVEGCVHGEVLQLLGGVPGVSTSDMGSNTLKCI